MFCIFYATNTYSQSLTTLDTLTFYNDYEEGHYLVPPAITSRFRMISSQRHGKIHIDTSELSNVDNLDVILLSLKIAKETWENYLDEDSLSLKVTVDNSIPTSIKTEVPYFSVIAENVSYPLSLYRHNHPSEATFPTTDARIIIKDPNEWQTGFEIADKKNLTLAFMQSIAVAMGFGSSIIQKTVRKNNESIVTLSSSNYSVTDFLISTLNNLHLTDISVSSRVTRNDSLENYVRGVYGSPYIMTDRGNYKLYTPSTYEDGASMRLLDMPGSLMSYSLPDSMEICVDDITADVLETIGWNLVHTQQEPDIYIVGEGLDSTGITSAYQSHLFYLAGETQGITNHHWTFELPLAIDGTYVLINSSDSESLTISALTDVSAYELLQEGAIKGLVSFNGLINGMSVNVKYYVTLELKPTILDIKFSNITPCSYDEDYFNVDVSVSYAGSHYLFANVQEEYGSLLYGYYSGTPYYTTFHLTDIDSWGSAWVHLTARNVYGSTTETYVIPLNSSSRRYTQSIEYLNQNVINVCVFEIDGTFKGRFPSVKEAENSCRSGLYVFSVTGEKGVKRYTKLIKR